MIIKLENKFHFGIISQEMVIDRGPGRVNTKNTHEPRSIIDRQLDFNICYQWIATKRKTSASDIKRK